MKRIQKIYWADLAAGPIVGVLFGLLEFAIHATRRAPLLLPSLIPGALLLYVLYWSLAGIVVALILALSRRLRVVRGGDFRLGFSILAGAAFTLTAHSALVAHLFVYLRRPWSTILFGCAIILILPLAYLIRRLLPKDTLSRPGRMVVLVLLILVASLPLQLLSEKRGERAAQADSPAKGPNILLVVFDTLRFNHTGTYGHDLPTTPNIDRLAEKGVVFENAYAPSSWTLPTTASLLTSRYPSGHSVTTRSSALSDEILTLPGHLRQAGYRTGLFSGNPFVEPNFGFQNGFSHWYTPSTPIYLRLFYLPYYLKRTIGRFPGTVDTNAWVTRYETFWRPVLGKEWIEGEILIDELFRWIDRDRVTPFFGHVQIMEPHDPYVGEGRFGPEGESVVHLFGIAPLHPFDQEPEPSSKRLRTMIGRYNDDVWNADRIFGTLLEELESRELAHDSWIVVTSDHGEEFWDHGGWGHGNSLYEELIRVPLIFRGEGIAPRRISSMARLVDVAPTLAELAGTTAPDEFVGRSLLPVLFGRTEETGITETFAELKRAAGREAKALLRADGTKIIFSQAGRLEEMMWFDLASDEGETQNLVMEDSSRAITLLQELQDAANEAAKGRVESATTTLDPVTERRLRALGYIGDE